MLYTEKKKELYETHEDFVRYTKPKTDFVHSTKLKKGLFICNDS